MGSWDYGFDRKRWGKTRKATWGGHLKKIHNLNLFCTFFNYPLNQTHLNFKIKNYIKKKDYVVRSRILKSDKILNMLKHMKATVMLFKNNKNKRFAMRK